MIVTALFLAGVLACNIVPGDVIHMRDVAAAEPAFTPVDGDATVSYAPLPGATRVIQGAQLERMAQRYGIDGGDLHDICFQRPMRQLDPSGLMAAFRQTLGIPDAEIELVDFSRFPAPAGDLVFPRSGLALNPLASPLPSLWKGYIIYGNGNHFAVWARVRLHVKLNRVVATDNLLPGRPVRADQLRVEPLDGVPDALAPAQSLSEVEGKMLLRPVRRGGTVSLDDVSTAITVKRGDKVDVEFETPGLHLRFEAAAEMDGRFGDHIRLRNLQSSNSFVGEVSGKDQARVVVLEENAEQNSDSGAAVRLAGRTCDRGQEEGEGCQ
jgi:flagella basal body P-ring formation protein FlgA